MLRFPPLPALVYEVVWERLNLGVMPFPLVVFQHGQDDQDRARFRAQAHHWLQANGLGSATHVNQSLIKALQTIARCDVELTLLYTDTHSTTRIGCFAVGGRALRVVLRADVLDLEWVDSSRMAVSMVEVIPAMGRGKAQSVQIPAGGLAAADHAWQASGMISGAIGELVHTGADPRQAEQFLQLYRTTQAIGQSSALRPGPVPERKLIAAHPVTFWDTTTGRYTITQHASWLTLAPADSPTLCTRIAKLLTSTFRS